MDRRRRLSRVRRQRARRMAETRNVEITRRRIKPKTPGTSLAKLARLTVHAAARSFQKPRVHFKPTPVRTQSAPSKTITLRSRRNTPTGSLYEPLNYTTVRTAINLCRRKAARRAVLLAKSGGRGIKAPGPYKKHTEPCK